MSTETLSIVEEDRLFFWDRVFKRRERSVEEDQFLVSSLTAVKSDVLTGRMHMTVSFYQAIQNAGLHKVPSGMASFGELIDLFCILATFDNLARAGYGDLLKPSFWIRDKRSHKGRIPALSLDVAALICNRRPSELRSALLPLVKDGAIEFIRSPGNIVAIAVKDGFLSDVEFKRIIERA